VVESELLQACLTNFQENIGFSAHKERQDTGRLTVHGSEE
jgi:hypothetical protein